MMTMAVLRPMRLDHLEDVCRIERDIFPSPWSFPQFGSELVDPASDWFVALDDDEVVGYVGVKEQDGMGHLMNIAVRADHRLSGAGGRLLAAAFDAARSRGLSAMTLEVRASNVDAQSFYRRHGFVAVGRRRSYYTDNGEDAVLMTVRLASGDPP